MSGVDHVEARSRVHTVHHGTGIAVYCLTILLCVTAVSVPAVSLWRRLHIGYLRQYRQWTEQWVDISWIRGWKDPSKPMGLRCM